MKNCPRKHFVALCSSFLIWVAIVSSQADNHAKEEILTKLSAHCKNAGPFPNSNNKHEDSTAAKRNPVAFISVARLSIRNVAKYFSPKVSSYLISNNILFEDAHFATDIKKGTSYFLIQCQSTLPVSLFTTLKNWIGTNSVEHSDDKDPRWDSDGVRFQKILADSLLVSLNISTLPGAVNVTCLQQQVKGSTSPYETSFRFSIFCNKRAKPGQLDFKADYIDKPIYVEMPSNEGALRVCLPMYPSGTENVVGWLNNSIPLEDFGDDPVPAKNSLLRHVIFITGAVMITVIVGVGLWKILRRAQELDDSVIDMTAGETRARVPPLD